MIRTAREMNSETREAIESSLMSLFEEATKDKEYSVEVDFNLVPDWLIAKLVNYGYDVCGDEQTAVVEISWENPRDVE